MYREKEKYILSREHLKSIDSRKNDDVKPMEKPLKVNMSIDDLAKLMMKNKTE